MSVAAYFIAGGVGAAWGFGELAGRYRDRPGRFTRTPAAVAYISISGLAAIVALTLIRAFNIDFGATGDAAATAVQVLAASVSGLAIFRLKFLDVTEHSGAVSVSPARLLENLLAVVDREVDRNQAARRSALVARVTVGLDFDAAYRALPAYALGLLENTSEDDQRRLAKDLNEIVQNNVPTDARIKLLAIALIRLTGPDLLELAVDAMRPQITTPPPAAPATRSA